MFDFPATPPPIEGQEFTPAGGPTYVWHAPVWTLKPVVGPGSGSGTVTSVAAASTVAGLSFSGSPVTTSGTLSLGGVVALSGGGTGATSASAARIALGAAPLLSPAFTGTPTAPT